MGTFLLTVHFANFNININIINTDNNHRLDTDHGGGNNINNNSNSSSSNNNNNNNNNWGLSPQVLCFSFFIHANLCMRGCKTQCWQLAGNTHAEAQEDCLLTLW